MLYDFSCAALYPLLFGISAPRDVWAMYVEQLMSEGEMGAWLPIRWGKTCLLISGLFRSVVPA